MTKHPTLPFPFNESVSVASFDLVHSDIWGPAPVTSLDGFSYYVYFIDDFSRYTWLYLLRHRSDVLIVYHQFSEMIFTQFGKRIKVFRSDGAREYLSSIFCDVVASHSTLSQ